MYTNYRPCDTETLSHLISHDEYYEKWDTIDKTKHKPSMPQPRIWHTQITTISSEDFFFVFREHLNLGTKIKKSCLNAPRILKNLKICRRFKMGSQNKKV